MNVAPVRRDLHIWCDHGAQVTPPMPFGPTERRDEPEGSGCACANCPRRENTSLIHVCVRGVPQNDAKKPWPSGHGGVRPA